jgi:hypothetical protein
MQTATGGGGANSTQPVASGLAPAATFKVMVSYHI